MKSHVCIPTKEALLSVAHGAQVAPLGRPLLTVKKKHMKTSFKGGKQTSIQL
jgi:hypothetical protein